MFWIASLHYSSLMWGFSYIIQYEKLKAKNMSHVITIKGKQSKKCMKLYIVIRYAHSVERFLEIVIIANFYSKNLNNTNLVIFNKYCILLYIQAWVKKISKHVTQMKYINARLYQTFCIPFQNAFKFDLYRKLTVQITGFRLNNA